MKESLFLEVLIKLTLSEDQTTQSAKHMVLVLMADSHISLTSSQWKLRELALVVSRWRSKVRQRRR